MMKLLPWYKKAAEQRHTGAGIALKRFADQGIWEAKQALELGKFIILQGKQVGMMCVISA